MPQEGTSPDVDPLDQTFTIQTGDTLDGKPLTDEIRVRIDESDVTADAVTTTIPVTVHVCGRVLSGTFEPQYPELGVASRDDGRYVITFARPLKQYTTMQGEYIMGAATGFVVPDEVGDRICEYFDLDTVDERAAEVAEESFEGQLRHRLEHDGSFREKVAAMVSHYE